MMKKWIPEYGSEVLRFEFDIEDMEFVENEISSIEGLHYEIEETDLGFKFEVQIPYFMNKGIDLYAINYVKGLHEGSKLFKDDKNKEKEIEEKPKKPNPFYELRTKLRLTQKEMATIVGLKGVHAKQRIQEIESERKKPTGPIKSMYELMFHLMNVDEVESKNVLEVWVQTVIDSN